MRSDDLFYYPELVGYNFKSDIYFYGVPGNKNGKMTHQVYIDSILEPIVRPWLEDKQDFVLEEDGDSGHGGTGRKNPVRRAGKKRMGIYLWIENCWAIPEKCILENSLTGDDNTLKGVDKRRVGSSEPGNFQL